MAIKIGIDAGHGGTSSGTNSCGKLYEKHYTLSLAKLAKERLEHNGFEVFMTRTNDTYVGDVSKRAQMCINAKCDYAVSLHFNGFNDEEANGCEVFVPNAEKSAGIEVGYYNYLGELFKKREPFARSSNPNKIFDKKMDTTTRKFGAVSNNKDYFGFIRTAWAGGLSADLLEVCFLTNKKDYDTYTKNESAIADAIARSIVEGYKKTYKTLGSTTATNSTTPTINTLGKKYYVQAGVFDSKINALALVQKLKNAGFDGIIKEE